MFLHMILTLAHWPDETARLEQLDHDVIASADQATLSFVA